ncbi:hypothetical protein BT69DRAFT_262564 [Atractiella rhizophila]|nr:hypothetical protein BT69DRAFT_262564 [Atractiella rhizophila]
MALRVASENRNVSYQRCKNQARYPSLWVAAFLLTSWSMPRPLVQGRLDLLAYLMWKWVDRSYSRVLSLFLLCLSKAGYLLILGFAKQSDISFTKDTSISQLLLRTSRHRRTLLTDHKFLQNVDTVYGVR